MTATSDANVPVKEGTTHTSNNAPLPPTAPRHPIHRVAITGGPCAGKTTALAEIAERLRSRGYGVFIVPEAATIMFTGGASLEKASDEHIINFQTQLFQNQMALEDSFANLATTSRHRQTFVLCDRGTCDGRAYMSSELWTSMLERNQWNMIDIRDGRYELVVHLVTAADGAQEYYTLDNNEARSETPVEACSVDRKTQAAWVGHPHLHIVDNRTGFREKINRVDSIISQLAGLHLSRRIVRKFLLSDDCGVQELHGDQANRTNSSSSDLEDGEQLDAMWMKLQSLSMHVEHFRVEQTFLSTGLGEDVQESVRLRGQNGVFTYVHKIRREDSETKRQITVREYNSLLAHADQSRGKVKITRNCFLHHGTYFVLDCITNVSPKIRLLRCHSDLADQKVNIPDGLNVETEVTGEKKYSIHAIATHVFKQ